jgi:hypothetical protein
MYLTAHSIRFKHVLSTLDRPKATAVYATARGSDRLNGLVVLRTVWAEERRLCV